MHVLEADSTPYALAQSGLPLIIEVTVIRRFTKV
jgi:hypothetical protein